MFKMGFFLGFGASLGFFAAKGLVHMVKKAYEHTKESFVMEEEDYYEETYDNVNDVDLSDTVAKEEETNE